MRRHLGPGIPIHFATNLFLHTLFEYLPTPTLLDSSSSSSSKQQQQQQQQRGGGSSAKRKTSRAGDKLRDKAIQQARGSKSRI